MSSKYRICTRCLMDTTDPNIVFDENGVCNHCHDHDRLMKQKVIAGKAGEEHLQKLVEQMKRDGRGKPYDCLIGVSGGVDSTYVAYLVKKMGLRPLAVHMDNGWDSELAVKNIEETLKRLGIDLHTEVLDWEEFKGLQVAFLRSSTPDSEIPSDHAIWAVLGDLADKLNVKYIVSGFNVRTETHLPRAWSQGHFDWKYIRSVNQLFGRGRLKTFPHIGFFTYYRRLLTHRRVDILNYIDFNKTEAMKILEQELGWRYYGGKHYESIYTRFYQGYILPTKFGYDKRRSHLSSLICSGETTRDAALKELDKPTYQPTMQEEDREYVVKKLGLTDDEFELILNAPKKTFWDYPSYGRVVEGPLLKGLYNIGRDWYRARQKRAHQAEA
ncbi:MAG: N-acetyl sugar amidotransferase [Anaerolineae bacterium]|nr:N-acetyl sugar amidotransferase [Anaerolineae bacterium]MBL8105015.1 N-acetyl sugar amidotransferase [Anaerolineales bacterium]MCC7187975.1 N-acetyl sugar amidotransferase [Anaerolineales bacterium]HQU35966.1 N-acetyl sugar amidotransferase [Anaerolineales bacterium]